MISVSLVFAPFLLSSALPLLAVAGPEWIPTGPQGGDVRALAVDPRVPGRIYLGASGGQLYRSDSGGELWQRLSPGFPRRDQNLDEIVVSPEGSLLVGFWDVHGRGGGVAVSSDAGLTFTIALDGESVRALSLAPSDSREVVAGALSGVFASSDGGLHWRRISPVGHPELRNVESVAVDPRDPRVIYAGTWHLPWKTVDGGLTWRPAAIGMIEDSDVFSMTLDRRDPQRVHATACSGIYGSRDGAKTWSRAQGIPFGSRRSRAFAQDVIQASTFYAGTTEGLFVSDDDTSTWRAATSLDLVVNAIAVLQDGTVLLGADGAGILRSRDRGRTWAPANHGFSERFVSRIVFDPLARRVLAGVWGDRVHGGVFAAPASRGGWVRLGEGLNGRDVATLAVAGGVTLAGTDRGLMALRSMDTVWRPVPLFAEMRPLHPRVNDLVTLGDSVVLAGTSAGLYRSEDAAVSWRAVRGVPGEVTALALSPSGELSLAATAAGLHESRDEGRTWRLLPQRPGNARINAILVVERGLGPALVATSRGLYRSLDAGLTWRPSEGGLPDSDFTSLTGGVGGASLFASDFLLGGVYRSDDQGLRWTRLEPTGMVSDRVWALAVSSTDPSELLSGSLTGGLHVMIGAARGR